jgi:hypothetical protein
MTGASQALSSCVKHLVDAMRQPDNTNSLSAAEMRANHATASMRAPTCRLRTDESLSHATCDLCDQRATLHITCGFRTHAEHKVRLANPRSAENRKLKNKNKIKPLAKMWSRLSTRNHPLYCIMVSVATGRHAKFHWDVV